MDVLKGIFLTIWSLVGLLLLIALVGMGMFVLGGGPQRMMSSFNPAQLFGGGANGGPGQMQPLGGQGQGSQPPTGGNQPGVGGQQPGGQPSGSGGKQQSSNTIQGQTLMPGSQGNPTGTAVQPQ